jgi:hypothetical protein
MFLFSSFAFFLPISQKISTINIGLLLIVSILDFKKDKFYFKTGIILPICLYIFYCLSLLYSSELQTDIVEQKASLLAFPIIFILYKDCTKNINFILKYFVLGCSIALILCEFKAFYNSFDFINLIFDSRTDKSISYYNSIQKEENLFFSFHFSSLHQAVYFSMYLLFAVIIIFYKNIFKNKLVSYGLLLFFVLGIFQILNKASLIVLFVVLIFKVYHFVKNKKKAILSIVLLSITTVSIFILNPRFKEFYKNNFIINNTELEVKDFKKIKNKNPNSNTDFRVMLWVSSIELIKENLIFGIGAGGSDNRLYEVFAVKRQWYDKKEKYHAHNQYLQILLDIGLVGFIPFIALFLYFFKFCYRIKDEKLKMIGINFILIVGINFLFESMFERYSGISFFMFFYCLFISLMDRVDKVVIK